MSAPAQVHLQGPQDEPMDIDPAPTHSPPSSSSAPRGLPLPGRFVNGAHEVVHHEIGRLHRKPLQDLCKTFGLPKTGNMATLTERLTNFSADRKAWDGLLPGARNKHRGPRVGGVTKSKKKKGTTKLSTLRRESLFGGTADGTGSMTGPYPTERSKDTRTDAEIADLMAWADRRVALNSQYGPTHPLYKPLPRGATDSGATNSGATDAGATDTTAPANGHTGNVPGSPVSETPDLAEQVRQLQAQFAELTARLESGNGAGVAPTSAVAIGVHADTVPPPPPTIAATERAVAARGGPGVVEPTTTGTINRCLSPSTVTPSQVTASFERPPPFAASNSGPLECLILASGKSLSFSKQSVPDPPSISFAKDLRLMMRIWDDNAPEWSPSEAVLHLQGEPIALKHWRDLYRYGKPGQWEGTKKHWANWRDIATSWQMLTEAGFWRKFSTENGPKSYTNICRALKAERKAADRCDAEKAKNIYSDGFASAFTYRRGGKHFVKSSDVAIARHFRSLQGSGSE